MRLVLFPSVHVLMRAEDLLRQAGIPFEVLPTPKEISRECGMCLGVGDERQEGVAAALAGCEHTIAEPPSEGP